MEKHGQDVFAAAAADTLPSSSSNSSGSSPVDRRRLYRKIDWHVMPLMFLCFLLQFLDKVSLNYSNVMGLQRDLGMGGQDFSWLATSFFVAFVAAEMPQAYLLQRFPVSRVLGCNVALWGLLLCCSAAARSFRGLLAVRILLGAAESCISPALVLVTSTWYTKRQACPRTGVWFCGVGTGQILGGLISFAAQHGPSSSSGFASWRTIGGAVVPRWLSIVLLMVPTIIGGALMSFFPGRAGALAGIYLINFTTAPAALVYSLVGANTSGYTKKVTANALMQVGFGLANIIGPQTFRSDEAPGYISAKITILASDAAAVVAVVLLRLLYGRRNRRTRAAREAQLASVASGETAVASLIEDEDLTDLKNPAFRYVY
ncbi:hypothetical protein MAPG_09604 [Magnaporthiopsis poae ATCC 64411]|uniref:Allantoate permease n=1 Tax=Magnaporthiopsis poae (strain ATCC 64411 / 73-15) TaxID=644358 RepID=A0A0C4EAD5_MAGP6|nr:hypothetical protein MAPG_09604 [Magnaporthiopsis poae ATCC 64411]